MRHQLTAAIWLASLALLGLATLQWSWNTIAELFDGPAVQIRHVLAAVLLVIAATAFAGTGRRHRRRGQDDHET
jgi:hypothetical protein